MSKLVIVAAYAHPDDAEFHAAGSLAKWAGQGHDVHAICATDGALGIKRLSPEGPSPQKVAEQRRSELENAMATIGGKPPVMLGFPDGFLRDHQPALRERLVYWFRKLRADRVITFDPWRTYEIHPDHIAVGRMASEAAVFSCFPLLHPEHREEGIEAKQPAEVWYMTPTGHRPNRIVDVASTIDKKIASLLCHSSQIEMLADWFVPGADPANLSDVERDQLKGGAAGFLDGMARACAMASQGKVELAEVFYALKTGPGHFDNYREMIGESLGAPAPDPELS